MSKSKKDKNPKKGNYTEDRHKWLDRDSMDEVIAKVRAKQNQRSDSLLS